MSDPWVPRHQFLREAVIFFMQTSSLMFKKKHHSLLHYVTWKENHPELFNIPSCNWGSSNHLCPQCSHEHIVAACEHAGNFRVEVHRWNKIGIRMKSKGFLCSGHPIQPLVVLVISTPKIGPYRIIFGLVTSGLLVIAIHHNYNCIIYIWLKRNSMMLE